MKFFKLFILIVSFSLSSCAKFSSLSFSNFLNGNFFALTGSLLSHSADLGSLKDFYLDYHNKMQDELIVKGVLREIHPSGSYLILEDATAKVLVLTSKLAAENDLSSLYTVGDQVLIWGSVYIGQRTFPQVKAKALVKDAETLSFPW